MQWTIRLKILAGFGVVLALLVVQFALTWGMAGQSVAAVTAARDEGYAGAILVEHIKFSVSQTWQWLTDVSATRSPDGFAEAEVYAQAFQRDLDALSALHTDKAEALRTLRAAFAEFYQQGRQMAQAYLDGGVERGNVAMEAFDAAGERLTTQLDAVVTEIESGADDQLQIAIDRAAQIRTLTGVAALLVTAAAIGVAWFIA